ncbi:MAG: hypothetical protein HFE79_00060 [Ruminiclostridium sp.]|nr:hypothetical protein [Ruminiclostridium sp.]
MATIFDNPANDMEKDIAEHIKPLVTAEVEEKIKKDKLTLKGCLDFCMKKGKKFEVKNGKAGIACITEEQHFKWARDYFGIKGNVIVKKSYVPNSVPVAPTVEKHKAALDVDFDSLFD